MAYARCLGAEIFVSGIECLLEGSMTLYFSGLEVVADAWVAMPNVRVKPPAEAGSVSLG